MGSQKFPRKKYDTPLHPWKEDRIKSERELIKKYGLKNHKEVWKAKTHLGKYREHARELLAKKEGKDPQVKKESDQLLLHLTRIGVLSAGSTLDDVLALETESFLSRRLQTLVYLKGFSSTVDHSRQLINHGHIAIGGRKVTIPGYILTKDEENEIGYTKKSPLSEVSHPSRPKADIYKTDAAIHPEEKIEEEKEATIELMKEEEPTSTVKEEKPKETEEETAKIKEEISGDKTEGKSKETAKPTKPKEQSQQNAHIQEEPVSSEKQTKEIDKEKKESKNAGEDD